MSDPSRGELALVLHTHMPYVEGYGTWPFGEEWLFEAIATAYLPLIELCDRWDGSGARDVLTISVTPVLADQLELPDVARRFLEFLAGTRVNTHRLDIAGLEDAGQSEAADALRHSARDYERAARQFERIGGDLLGAWERLRAQGVIDVWASAATHAVLPMLASEAGVRLQVETGIDAHRRRFGEWSGGFWLPECAYREGLDEQLGLAGARAFCVDQTLDGDGLDELEPVAVAGGAVAIPIDWRSISLVWDERGYPADPAYRDYHAQSLNGLRPYANGGGPYRPEAARERARLHARDFVRRVCERLERYRESRGRAGLAVCALDTELLGHWWYEGPVFLEAVVSEAAAADLALTTLPAALERHPPRDRPLRESSWGAEKDLRTWGWAASAELVWPARRGELALASALTAGGPEEPAAAERAARELLALQSSDWAFMAARGVAGEYPHDRVREHAVGFERALAALRPGVRDSPAVLGTETTKPGGDGVPAGHNGVEASLRGLAPSLRLSALVEPSSGPGRDAGDPVVAAEARAAS